MAKKEYICSKLVSIEKVAKRSPLGRVLEDMTTNQQYAYLGNQYEAQEKYDGCATVIHLPLMSYPSAESRTGEPLLSTDVQIRSIASDLDGIVEASSDGLVLIAEAWWPGAEQFDEISGAFRKKSEQRPRLQFVVNDVFTSQEYQAGKTSVPYKLRLGRLDGVQSSGSWSIAKRYAPGSYGDPRDLCASVVDRGGYDGIVLVDPEAGWNLDLGTNGEKIKVKRELSFDLRVTGIKTGVGEKTGRAVYTVTVDFQGRELDVGSGVPHAFENLPRVGDIVEVCAMKLSKDGMLREPRYKGIRHDKLEPDT